MYQLLFPCCFYCAPLLHSPIIRPASPRSSSLALSLLRSHSSAPRSSDFVKAGIATLPKFYLLLLPFLLGLIDLGLVFCSYPAVIYRYLFHIISVTGSSTTHAHRARH